MHNNLLKVVNIAIDSWSSSGLKISLKNSVCGPRVAPLNTTKNPTRLLAIHTITHLWALFPHFYVEWYLCERAVTRKHTHIRSCFIGIDETSLDAEILAGRKFFLSSQCKNTISEYIASLKLATCKQPKWQNLCCWFFFAVQIGQSSELHLITSESFAYAIISPGQSPSQTYHQTTIPTNGGCRSLS